MSIAKNLEFLRHLPKPNALQDALGMGWGTGGGAAGPLIETTDFGTNPGHLAMLSYVPHGLAEDVPLVVVLHGCTQNAVGYNTGAGWSTLAERYGFALLMPEQKRGNNPNTCFNWFDPSDIIRDSGEAASIRQMIARMSQDHGIDKARIFITGLSAGGAMASVMLATYPEVFAAGAVIAGLPYGVAISVTEALGAMRQPTPRSAEVLGDLVRGASKYDGAWPRVSVWHGTADRTVNPANADDVVKQWLDVHGLPTSPMSQGVVDGYPRQVWWGANGETIVESYTITDMAHGTPLGFGEGEERFGAQGPYLIEAGISSSYYIAQFFGLTERVYQPRSKPAPFMSAIDPAPAKSTAKTVTKPAPEAVTFSVRPVDQAHSPARRNRTIDVNAIITRALTAAGLMK